MTGRRRLGLVAAGATLLSAAPISTIFSAWTWLLECIFAVGLICGAAFLTRTFRFPVWAQIVSEFVALLVALTWMFPGEHNLLIPTPGTFSHFGDLLTQAGEDTRNYGVPVPDRPGLLFTAVLGIGLVAILVDVLTVILRRPALAGLPMLAIYSVPVAIYVDSVPVTPFIVGSIGYLWLLVSDNIDRVRRFGRRFTGDGRDVDVWEPSPLSAAGRRLGLVGLLAAVLVPLLVPSITGGLLSQLTQSGNGVGQGGIGNGTGSGISLFASLSGNLGNSETIDFLKVTTDDPNPYYLRFGVADQVTTKGFTTRPPAGQSLSRGLPDPRSGSTTTDQDDFANYHADVQITTKWGDGQYLLPVYSGATQINGLSGGWNYDVSQSVVYSTHDNVKGKKYSLDYVRANYTADELRSAQPLDKGNSLVLSYTNTPPDQTVTTQVNKLIKGKTTEYDQVLALYDFFSAKNGFKYDLATVPVGGASDIAAFLKNRVGFCQQYAAALAWMARVAGFPARVAFGFTRGAATGKSTYDITNKNAHAWTEIYFDGYGWVPFDATPAGGVPGSARSATDWAPNVDAPASSASASSSAGIGGANPSARVSRQDRPDRGFDGDTSAAAGTGPAGFSTTGLLVSIAVALLIVLLLMPSVRRVLLRRHRHAATVPRQVSAQVSGPADIVVTTEAVQAREDAHAAWDELVDTMIDYRIPIDPSETPRVTARRLIDETVLQSEPATAVTLLGTAEEQARYARRPMQGAELPPALRLVRKGLARSATRRTRLVAAVMPPSVLLRWRVALGDLSARSVGVAGRMREVLVRFSPRRLLPRSR